MTRHMVPTHITWVWWLVLSLQSILTTSQPPGAFGQSSHLSPILQSVSDIAPGLIGTTQVGPTADCLIWDLGQIGNTGEHNLLVPGRSYNNSREEAKKNVDPSKVGKSGVYEGSKRQFGIQNKVLVLVVQCVIVKGNVTQTDVRVGRLKFPVQQNATLKFSASINKHSIV